MKAIWSHAHTLALTAFAVLSVGCARQNGWNFPTTELDDILEIGVCESKESREKRQSQVSDFAEKGGEIGGAIPRAANTGIGMITGESQPVETLDEAAWAVAGATAGAWVGKKVVSWTEAAQYVFQIKNSAKRKEIKLRWYLWDSYNPHKDAVRGHEVLTIGPYATLELDAAEMGLKLKHGSHGYLQAEGFKKKIYYKVVKKGELLSLYTETDF